jgi:hypothetical protein
VPGTTDIGNHSDDLVTTIPLPFSYTLYGTTFTSINLSSNGNAQFTTTAPAPVNVCLPWSGHNATIFPYWDDLRTDAQTGCFGFPGGTCGIYTSVSGSVPNRIFNIEWRTVYFDSLTQSANFELRLYEGQTRFDVIYGAVVQTNIGATAGTQRDDNCFSQYFCNGVGGPASGGWTLVPVGTPSPTPTATATVTPTATATASPISTPTPSEPPCSVIGTQPPCDSTVFTQLTDFVVNIDAPVDPATVQPSDFTVNGTPADDDGVGGTSITFHFNASPVVQGQNTMHIPSNAFVCAGSQRGVLGFTCAFTYQPSTPTPTPTPRVAPTARVRPTPAPRP